MKNLPLLIGTIVGTIILVVVLAFAFSNSSDGPLSSETYSESELVSESTHFKGADESALVTIVEFSDLQCPACRAAQPMVERVLAQYPDEVRLAYRHFPLDSIHPNARPAAAATEVAAEEGKFWEMHDLLFAGQQEWSDIRSRDELYQKFSEYAEQLQIDKSTFIEKIESDQVKEKVQEDSLAAQRLGLQGTPTFFVNGRVVPAPQLLTAVESIVSGSNTTQ